MSDTRKYVIHYKLDDQRCWDFAQLTDDSLEQARAALKTMHGEDAERITEIRVTRAL